jgi:hypothetical protein
LSYRRNRRPRVYDAEEIAQNARETFAARAVEFRTEFSFGWPSIVQNVGDSLAVAYASDKWEKKKNGVRNVELYKHLAESRNQVLCLPGLLRDESAPEREWEAYGPLVSLGDAPMPGHFAILGLFEEANLQLYTHAKSGEPRFGRGDAGIVRVEVRHGMLGFSKMRWNEVEPYKSERESNPRLDFDQPFLFVYTESDGVLLLVVGERLDVTTDGIVG